MFNAQLKKQLAQITAQHRPLQDLLESLRRTVALIEFSQDGIILDANKLFCETMGYSLEEVRGLHHKIFCDEELVRSSAYSSFWVKLRNGESFNGQFKRVRKNGEQIYLEATYFPVRDESGTVTKIFKIASDITDRVKEAEASRNIISALNRSMAVIEFDMAGKVISANQNFLDVMLFTNDTLVGQHHRILCQPSYANSPEYLQLWASLKRGEFFSGICERLKHNGEVVWLRATYNPVLDEAGNPIRVIKFATDITARIEQQKKRLMLPRKLIRALVEPPNYPKTAIWYLMKSWGKCVISPNKSAAR